METKPVIMTGKPSINLLHKHRLRHIVRQVPKHNLSSIQCTLHPYDTIRNHQALNEVFNQRIQTLGGCNLSNLSVNYIFSPMIARSVLNFEGKQVSYACELGDGDGLEEKIGEIEVVCVHIDEVCWSVYVWFWWRICRMEERLIQNLKLPGKEECKSLWLNVVVEVSKHLSSKHRTVQRI